MAINQTQVISQIVEYIEDNIHNDINQDGITDFSNISKSHLHRIFKALTGKSLMEYVRGRKLAYSLQDLGSTKLKIIDIACEYGFRQEQNFIRAFKSAFGITPHQYRKKQKELVIQQKIDSNLFSTIFDNIVVAPYYVVRPAFSLLGIEHTIYEDDDIKNGLANQAGIHFMHHIRKNLSDIILEKDVYYALVKHYLPDQTVNTYIPSARITPNTKPREGMVINHIPQNTYAVFKYIGLHPAEEINTRVLLEIFRTIFCLWVENSNIQWQRNFHFEKINTAICSIDYCEMELFLPVDQRSINKR